MINLINSFILVFSKQYPFDCIKIRKGIILKKDINLWECPLTSKDNSFLPCGHILCLERHALLPREAFLFATY